jgi:hypothetical protein
MQGRDLLPKNMTIGTREIPPEAERTANPLQTTPFFGVKRGFRWDAVEGGNPTMIAAGIGGACVN